MNAHGFTSMFAPQLDEYLAFKEKMGFFGSSRIWYLQKFEPTAPNTTGASATATPSKGGWSTS